MKRKRNHSLKWYTTTRKEIQNVNIDETRQVLNHKKVVLELINDMKINGHK